MGSYVLVVVVKIAAYYLGAVGMVVVLLGKEVCDGQELPMARS